MSSKPRRPRPKSPRKHPAGSGLPPVPPPPREPPGVAATLMPAFTAAAKAETPLHAEALVSEFLGIVWEGWGVDDNEPVEAICGYLSTELAALGSRGRAPLEVLARMAPQPLRAEISATASSVLGPLPQWTPMLDNVCLLRGITTSDPYGDQTNHIMEFAYAEEDHLVGHHVIVAMIDHNLHILKDAFLADGAQAFDGIREMSGQEVEITVDDDFDALESATALSVAMWGTQNLPNMSEVLVEGTGEVWHLLGARLTSCLPEPQDAVDPDVVWPGTERAKYVTAFMRSAAAKDFLAWPIHGHVPDRAATKELAELFVRFAVDNGRGYPWAWSPTAVRIFLLEFLPITPIWCDVTPVEIVPALKVFVEWSLKRAGVPLRFRLDVARMIDDPEALLPGFDVGGELDGSFVAAVLAEIEAAGVDLTDGGAVQAYLEAMTAQDPGLA